MSQALPGAALPQQRRPPVVRLVREVSLPAPARRTRTPAATGTRPAAAETQAADFPGASGSAAAGGAPPGRPRPPAADQGTRQALRREVLALLLPARLLHAGPRKRARRC